MAGDTLEVVSLNRERLLSESAFGRAMIGSLSDQQQALVIENQRLTEELETEERALTETRKTMSAEEFRPLAEAFDEKVKQVRAAQDGKAVDLAKAREAARFSFFRRIEPVIIEIMQSRGARVLLNNQAVLLSTDDVDITAAVLARLDALFAQGALAVE
ncbi:MAG: OmpH family outer membrane protein [Pseudomonadota bacterium]